MKKILMLLIVFALTLFSFATFNTTYAAETTEQPTTEEATTEEIVTNEPVTEPAESEQSFYINDEGNFVVNGIELTREQLMRISYEYLDDQFGDKLGAIGGVIIAVIVVFIGLGAYGIRKISNNVLETRKLNQTNNEVVKVKDGVEENTAAIKRMDAREAKREAMNAKILEGLSLIMANSTNPNLLGAAQTFKAGAEKIMNIEDNLDEAVDYIKTATKEVKNIIVGSTAEENKKKRAEIIKQMSKEEE